MSSAKRGGQDISLYMQSWVASNPISRSSTYPTPFSLNGVSLLMASALRYALRTPYSAPIRSPFVDTYQWKLTVLPVIVSLCLSMSKYYFYPYQLSPTPYPRYFKLTGYGVMFFWLTIFGPGERENYLWVIPRAAIHLMLGHVARSRWLHFWMRASLRLSHIFPPIYNAHPSSHSFISTLLIPERKSSSPSLSSTYPWLPSSC